MEPNAIPASRPFRRFHPAVTLPRLAPEPHRDPRAVADTVRSRDAGQPGHEGRAAKLTTGGCAYGRPACLSCVLADFGTAGGRDTPDRLGGRTQPGRSRGQCLRCELRREL